MIPTEIEAVALLGWYLYPCSRTSKAGAFPGALDAATCDLDRIESWARTYPGCNWRVVCGPSGLFALDVDRPGTHKADGFAAMVALTAQHGALPERPTTRTGGSGGAALFFRHQGEPLRGQSGKPAPGLDPHRGRQAIMIPPSRHPVTGGGYTWRISPVKLAPPPIPVWLATLLKPPLEPAAPTYRLTSERARAAVMRAVGAVQDAPSGGANDTLNRRAYSLGRWIGAGLLTEAEASSALVHAAALRHIPGPEARATIRSGLRAGQRNPMEAARG